MQLEVAWERFCSVGYCVVGAEGGGVEVGGKFCVGGGGGVCCGFSTAGGLRSCAFSRRFLIIVTVSQIAHVASAKLPLINARRFPIAGAA